MPNNLRIVNNNLVDKASTKLIASSTSTAATSVENLRKNVKSSVWRSATATVDTVTAYLQLQFDSPKNITCVALPYTNLTSSATIRVYGYADTAPSLTGTVDAPTVTGGIGVSLIDIAYNGTDTYVAVGGGGAIMYSTDLINWTYVAFANRYDPTYTLQSVAYGAGKFIAGGTGGILFVSTNGIDWEVSTALLQTGWSNAFINRLQYIDNKFVACSTTGRFTYSTDGVTWTYTSTGSSNTGRYVVYNGDKWMVATTNARVVYASSVAGPWTVDTTSLPATGWGATQHAYSTFYDSVSGRWFLGGDLGGVAYSTDLITWTYQAPDGNWGSTNLIYEFARAGTRLYKFGTNGRIAYSTDNGNTWTYAYNATWGTRHVYTGRMFGTKLLLAGTISSFMFSEDNGTTWNYRGNLLSSAFAFSTPAVNACAWSTLENTSLGTSVSRYSYGEGSAAVVWIPASVPVRNILVMITDTRTGSDKYIEASKLVVGEYWSPKYNTSYGLSAGIVDMSEHERAESGDLLTKRGPMYRTLTFDLGILDGTDRIAFTKMLINSAKSNPIFISLFPEAGTTPDLLEKERSHMLYGKLVQLPGLENFALDFYSTQVEIEEV